MARWVLAGLGLAWAHVGWAATAASAWKEIDQLTNASAQIDLRRGKQAETDFSNLLQLIRFRTEDFVRLYPTDAKRWDAEVLRLRVTEQLTLNAGREVDWAAQQAAYAEVVAAPGAKKDAKISARIGSLSARIAQAGTGMKRGDLIALSAECDELFAKNRDDMRLASLNLQLGTWLGQIDTVKSEKMLKRVADVNEPKLAKKAAGMIHVVRSWREPLDLKFKGVDGAPVDLAALRGKVVLIDFWATWCPPCRDEMPSVVATYRRLREQGFEIVGISLDDDRSKLLDYMRAQGVTWPQHFDGGGWQNALAQRFGISSVPTMWLIDQQGRIVDTEARTNLTNKVERLLAKK